MQSYTLEKLESDLEKFEDSFDKFLNSQRQNSNSNGQYRDPDNVFLARLMINAIGIVLSIYYLKSHNQDVRQFTFRSWEVFNKYLPEVALYFPDDQAVYYKLILTLLNCWRG